MKRLHPMLATDGLIRVGGRLSNSMYASMTKHPIILSAKHRFTVMLVEHYHEILLHAGPQLMMSSLHRKLWIIGLRSLARSVYHKCLTCFRHKPTLVQQAMGDVPRSRITPSKPFSVTGVDYCGPFYLKGPSRKSGPVKAYIAVFVCFVTRAVHLELVSDLSTTAFLAALHRFVGRRGHVREIHSDNGTNFKGAANELNHLYKMFKVNEHDRKKYLLGAPMRTLYGNSYPQELHTLGDYGRQQ